MIVLFGENTTVGHLAISGRSRPVRRAVSGAISSLILRTFQESTLVKIHTTNNARR